VSLLVGESLGFALGAYSSLWETLAVLGAIIFLFLWGLSVKNLLFPFILILGIILGAKSEELRRVIISEQEGGFGTPKDVELEIESSVSEYIRRDGERGISFLSTLGNVPLRVSAPLKEGNDMPKKGDVWLCRGWLSLSRDSSNRKFARRSFWIGTKNVFRKVSSSSSRKTSSFYGNVNNFLSRVCDIGTLWCPEIANLNKAILLGNRGLMSKEMNLAFSIAGTIHVFAISGLHIGLVAKFLMFLLGRLGASNRISVIVSIPLLVAFVVLSGSKPSAIRALIMMILVMAGPMFARRSNPFTAWSITAILVYGYSPEMLYDIGCMFSFVVMLGIVLMLEANKTIKHAMALAGNLKTSANWAEEGNTFGAFSNKVTLVISLAAWVMSVPVSAIFFGRISFGALLANIVVIKLAEASVRFGFASLCVSLISTPLVFLLNNCCVLITWSMVIISTYVAKIPYSSIEVAPWGGVECFLWYGIWFFVFKLSMWIILRKITCQGKWW
jgi:ComEC/Rec2-related protein